MDHLQVNAYLEELIPDRDDLLLEMEKYAEINQVPIMELVGIEAMIQCLRLIQPNRIVEIGAAIGYSAIRMAEALPKSTIVTIERDEERYEKALHFIQRANLQDRILIKFGDALEIAEQVEKDGPYDALFIDAAKGQYERFFNLYTPFLSSRGVVLSDNVLFKGLVADDQIENKRLRGLVKKIKKYNEWLMKHPDFDTAIIPVGDGIAISKKRGE
jgi:predicted O-methyltransferase YrrM